MIIENPGNLIPLNIKICKVCLKISISCEVIYLKIVIKKDQNFAIKM